MQLNKCSRCGAFFTENNDVCANCRPKDLFEINKLKSYLEDCSINSSFKEISHGTGISEKNLHRFFSYDDLNNYSNETNL